MLQLTRSAAALRFALAEGFREDVDERPVSEIVRATRGRRLGRGGPPQVIESELSAPTLGFSMLSELDYATQHLQIRVGSGDASVNHSGQPVFSQPQFPQLLQPLR